MTKQSPDSFRPRPTPGKEAHARYDAARLQRWGWASLALNVLLALLHGVLALASGSLAVTAELLHNGVDFIASLAVLIGLRLATRKSEAFPYGLYKVENLLAAGLALLIFISVYEMLHKALFVSSPPVRADGWMIALLLLTTVLPLVFSHFELRVALATHSPALLADAKEYRVHIYTTGLALVALLGHNTHWPIDRIATIVIVVVIVRTGWDLLRDAMRVLLDASLDQETLGQVSRMIDAVPEVSELRWVTGRNAGRFRFVEAGVTLRVVELEKAEAIVHRIEADVRRGVANIERVLIHIEPSDMTHRRYAIPLTDRDGTISAHFGEAPYFAIMTVNRAEGSVTGQQVISNPHQRLEKAKGIRVAEWLVTQKIDELLLQEDIRGKGPEYVFRQAGISIAMTDKPTLDAALSANTGRHSLGHHSSEKGGGQHEGTGRSSPPDVAA